MCALRFLVCVYFLLRAICYIPYYSCFLACGLILNLTQTYLFLSQTFPIRDINVHNQIHMTFFPPIFVLFFPHLGRKTQLNHLDAMTRKRANVLHLSIEICYLFGHKLPFSNICIWPFNSIVSKLYQNQSKTLLVSQRFGQHSRKKSKKCDKKVHSLFRLLLVCVRFFNRVVVVLWYL